MLPETSSDCDQFKYQIAFFVVVLIDSFFSGNKIIVYNWNNNFDEHIYL